MRVSASVKKICRNCKIIRRKNVVRVICTDPRHKQPKTYWVQVEGEPSGEQLAALRDGLQLNDGRTLPAQARRIETPALWPLVRKPDSQRARDYRPAPSF